MIDFGKTLANKKKEYEECNHLFVKTKEENEYFPCNVTCLKCGLTNFHINMNAEQKQKYNSLVRRVNPVKFYTLIINDEVFINNYCKCNNETINLISDEVLNADDVMMLYKEAKDNYPDLGNNELFDVMKKLNNEYVLKRKR